MFFFTIFDPDTREVLSHKTCSHVDQVLANIPAGLDAAIGHLDRGEPVPLDVAPITDAIGSPALDLTASGEDAPAEQE
jgi:hypothetical protein